MQQCIKRPLVSKSFSTLSNIFLNHSSGLLNSKNWIKWLGMRKGPQRPVEATEGRSSNGIKVHKKIHFSHRIQNWLGKERKYSSLSISPQPKFLLSQFQVNSGANSWTKALKQTSKSNKTFHITFLHQLKAFWVVLKHAGQHRHVCTIQIDYCKLI